MKINEAIYFILMIAGIALLAFGETYIRKEYALSIGFVLIMFGMYKMSLSWRKHRSNDEEDS